MRKNFFIFWSPIPNGISIFSPPQQSENQAKISILIPVAEFRHSESNAQEFSVSVLPNFIFPVTLS